MKRIGTLILFALFFIGLQTYIVPIAFAATGTNVDELAQKIKDRTEAIKKLEEETKQIQNQLQQTTTVSKTLQGALSQLDLTRKKLTKDLIVTEKTIDTTNLSIEQLGDQIDDATARLDTHKKALAESISALNDKDQQSLVEVVLSNDSLSSFFDDVAKQAQVQVAIDTRMAEITSISQELADKKSQAENKKQNLVQLKKELAGKKQSVESTKQQTSSLLSQTKNKEANYQNLLAQKAAERAAFEKELFDFESALKLAVDPASYPSRGSSVLSWPLDHIVITQRFGKTVDARRLYVSGTHNGVDFGTPIGTPVKTALSGVVQGVGNTDIYPGCYSYGKWIYIKHPNGLGSIYGHLSSQIVQVGDTVTTGQIIGYSGNTGYSTGPHLHFTLYANQGVQIQKYFSSVGCKNATIPLADIKAYLDPLDYFPAS